MNDAKRTITLLACCCTILTVIPSASADFVGVTTVIKDDPDTDFLCTQGNGDYVPGPLTVCNVFAVFDDPDDVLRSVGNADLQVYNGANPDVFYQHQINSTVTAPSCFFVHVLFLDLICDSFITIGLECGPQPAGTDTTTPDDDFDASEFQSNGHVVGGWFTGPDGGYSPLDQGEAGNYPDLQVLFLQSSVAQGLSLSGDIDIFWEDPDTGEVIAEVDVPVECAGVDQDSCECVNGRVTLCHIPPGNRANARTITVGCAAGDKHLAHGDTCGPCE